LKSGITNSNDFDEILARNVVHGVFLLLQTREREKFLKEYGEISINGLKKTTIADSDKKIKNLLTEKDIKIEEFKKMAKNIEDKVQIELRDYKIKAKEQEKTIYELSKKIKELRELGENIDIKEELKEKELVIEVKENEREITEEDFINIIKTHNICIYGGIGNWQKKIKKKYPEIHMMEATSTVSLKPLDKAFIVIFVNIWTSHCAWDRVSTYADNINLPKGHLNNYNERFLWEVVVSEVEKVHMKNI